MFKRKAEDGCGESRTSKKPTNESLILHEAMEGPNPQQEESDLSAELQGNFIYETQFPTVWSRVQFEEFQRKNDWLVASHGKLGCRTCGYVSNLKIFSPRGRGVNIASQWSECRISSFGKTRKTQLTSLRKKIIEHKNSAAHTEATRLLEAAKRDSLLKAKYEEAAFVTTARVFRTAYYVAKMNRPFTDHKSLIDLQKVNGVEMGQLLQSRTVCRDIIQHISAEMKKRIVSRIIETKSKITVLVDEYSTLAQKSTLIIFLKASVDGVMNPVAFPLDLVELDNTSVESIKQNIIKCLQCYGFTMDLLTEVFLSFCSDGANVMLGVKAGLGRLLQKDFPNLILWHCLNHKLELAVDQVLNVTGGTNDFREFLDNLYSLCSQSPKNACDLRANATELHVVLKKIGRVFSVQWVASTWRAVSAVWQTYPALAKYFQEASQDQTRDGRERAKFQGLHSKLCSAQFVKNLSLMLDVLTELKNLSELLQDRELMIPKADSLMKIYLQRIDSLRRIPGLHTKQALQAEEAMMFKNTKLTSARKNLTINPSQFIQAVVDNLRCKLFTTTANQSTQSTAESSEMADQNLIENVSVLKPETWQQHAEDPWFGETEIHALCETLKVHPHETHLGFVEYKCCAGLTVPEKLKKLLLAVHTLAASNADCCEQVFNVMNNIITDTRTALTTRHVADLLFISIVGPPYTEWNPAPYVKSWLSQGRQAANSAESVARRKQPKPQQDQAYYAPLWRCL
ncbi:E3 SUMO-protein ligase KIAA1586-like [Carettochelys insculpta]|uniref:E3 SUMO-protein ligase KIAA1586-like n=1 Tax=Carettochelys insculpta TaxID=44489 RepID=UPI003EBA7A4F